MRWPWQRRTAAEPRPPADDVDEAAQARRAAEEGLERTQEQTAEVRALAEQLRAHRRVNHFAELLAQSFGRPR